MTDHPPPTGDEAPNLLLPPDAARALAALIAAGEEAGKAGARWEDVGYVCREHGDGAAISASDDADDWLAEALASVRAALADPALAAVRRTLAGEG